MAAKKKVAMVQPPPARPAKKADLVDVLQQLGNDRPYVLVVTGVDHWIVHFIGDYKPSGIMLVDGKWKIIHQK
jgi:hypothetical protein